jgi:hypothetical protein
MKTTRIVNTVMRPSDFDGDVYDGKDCAGHRAFKRALKSRPMWERVFVWVSNNWSVKSNVRDSWYSYRSGVTVSMMSEVSVGDYITFKKQ